MKFSHPLFFVSLALLVLSNCNKKEDEPSAYQISPCEIFKPTSISWFTPSRYQYRGPVVNPKNANEIAYIYSDFELQEHSLRIYDRNTDSETVIVDNIHPDAHSLRMDWSTMDEIAYIDEAYKVNIVDRNGNHRILDSDLTNLFPLFNKTGQFITTLQSDSLGYPYVLGRYTLSSNHRDTLYQGYLRYSTLAPADDEILFVSKSGDNQFLTIGSFDGVAPQDIVDLSAYEIVNARHFTADSIAQNIYFISQIRGLFRTSRSGQSPELLINYCSNIRLISPTISPDGRQLIVEKIMREQLHNEGGSVTGEIRESSQIAVLDLTTFELETLLP